MTIVWNVRLYIRDLYEAMTRIQTRLINSSYIFDKLDIVTKSIENELLNVT
ncbi:hypothetical protein D3C80_2090010 [compost metagenome]